MIEHLFQSLMDYVAIPLLYFVIRTETRIAKLETQMKYHVNGVFARMTEKKP